MRVRLNGRWLAGAAAALLLLAAGTPARASVLTFDIAGISDFGDIPTAYGDRVTSLNQGPFSYGLGNGFTPNVVVDYRTLSVGAIGTGGGTLYNHLDWWSSSYGDLVNIAYPVDPTSAAELSFTADAGWAVRLNSFDLAGWPNADHPNQPLLILDGNYNVLANLGPVTIPGDFVGPRRLTVNLNLPAQTTIRVQFGNNWSVGIDNVNFDQVPTQVIIPEPASVTLLSLGALGLAGFAWRRKRAR